MSKEATLKVYDGTEWEEYTFGVDRVVEYGKKNGWSYRKWESGYAELWGKFGATQVGNANLCHAATSELPFAVKATSNAAVNVNYGAAGNATSYTAHVNMPNNVSIDAYGAPKSSNAWFYIHISGEWK